MARQLDTAQSAVQVAESFVRPGRPKPAVVVSIAGGRTEPFVDVSHLETELDRVCDVYVLSHGEASWAFTKALPEGRQVFGGASRVYATDLEWVRDQYASPLRFAYSDADGRRVTAQLVEDALTAVFRDRQQAPPPRAGRVERAGTIRGIVGGRGLVELDSGGSILPATIQPELVAPGVPAERMFAIGQRVSGLYDADSNRLDVEGAVAPMVACAEVAAEDVLLAQVVKIGDRYVTVRVLPGCEVRVPIDEFEEDANVGRLVTVDEILAVQVRELVDGVPAKVSLLPPNFADLAHPVAIFDGGPPFLLPKDVGAARSATSDDLAVAPPSDLTDEPPIDPADPEAPLLAETSALRRRLRSAEREVETLKQQLAAAKTAARTAKQGARALTKDLEAARAQRASVRPNLFTDPADQFRYEVYVAWAERTTADDKATRRWTEPAIGPGFLATLDSTEGVDRAKVVEVVADIVSGHAERMAGRGLHQLRRGAGANDPIVTRPDGATCWRIYLQQNAPSARRLHFWRLPDGTIELSSVRLHDDNQP